MAKSSTSFQPGQSGNPGGRPKAAIAMRDRIRERGGDLADFLFNAMDNADVPWAQRVNAARTLYEFGYGKAPASVKIENKEPSAAEQWISILRQLDGIRKKDKQPKPASNAAHTATPNSAGTDTIQ